MKALLDACVLYPTVMRQMLLGAAEAGLFRPLWSPRILEEWRRAAAKLGGVQTAVVEGEIARAEAAWPGASIPAPEGLAARLYLPDRHDVHVLASAIHGGADVLVTLNARDFPRGLLAEEGLARADPDGFLLGFHAAHPGIIADLAARLQSEVETASGEGWPIRRLMKKARLPRLGKALEGAEFSRKF